MDIVAVEDKIYNDEHPANTQMRIKDTDDTHLRSISSYCNLKESNKKLDFHRNSSLMVYWKCFISNDISVYIRIYPK